MKKIVLSFLYLLGTSFFLSGLQGNLYFLPIPLPYFWFIILTYYSFKKNLLFSLTANLLHVFILSSFTSLSLSLLLIVLNLISFTFSIIKERFRTDQVHIVIASGTGCLVFLATVWSTKSLVHFFSTPDIFNWVGTAFMTLIFTPPFIFIFDLIDQKIHFERVDTLENLRI